MNLVFVIPLTVSIVAAYLCQKTAQEMAYLTGSITIISLLISLMIAPWQLQLIIVIVALIIARQLWQQLNALEASSEIVSVEENKPAATSSSTESDVQEGKSAKKYRGLIYNPEIELINTVNAPSTIERKYRGTTVTIGEIPANFSIKQKPNLKYRGIDISTQSSPEESQQ
jgi:hypothetical protein